MGVAQHTMGGDGSTTGSGADGHRTTKMNKERAAAQKELQNRKDKIEEFNQSGLGTIGQRFSATDSSVEEDLAMRTVGLVDMAEFKRRRDALEAPKAAGADGEQPPKDKKRMKNPNVKTDFLPDREKDEKEAAERAKLEHEWLEKQQAIKAEPLEVTYSYQMASGQGNRGHRNKTTVKKGSTIAEFLEQVRAELKSEFKELRGCAVDNLMYIKEDLILGHHHTFYDFISKKARGKSGPLFHFDEGPCSDESHAGKICERFWYEKNKLNFPASRWEMYDSSMINGFKQ